MPPTDHMLAFALTAAVIVGVPGPSVLFVVTRSLTLGRRAGVLTVVGNALGVYVQVIAVAFGLGAIVQESVTVFTAIKLVGAAYLVVLGVRAFRHRGELAAALDVPVSPKTQRRIFRDGFVVGLANPKAIVAFVAVLPQFVDRGAGHVPEQLLILGAIFFVIALVSDSAWALAAGTARAWLARSPRRLSAIGGAGGVTMIGIGAGLALSGRKD
jgi:threonine/homoserine/homoserine lactone efflux protein